VHVGQEKKKRRKERKEEEKKRRREEEKKRRSDEVKLAVGLITMVKAPYWTGDNVGARSQESYFAGDAGSGMLVRAVMLGGF